MIFAKSLASFILASSWPERHATIECRLHLNFALIFQRAGFRGINALLAPSIFENGTPEDE